ncbi:oligosaccharide flippase family protein [Priestia megaterium]|uniref:lipopolysaccharide biosynthesis protein n=1 Tax=Priestia megaterium TaxID=1404 RepID=UPI001C247A6E|nr:polysaccharide biosynthesis C-terminal domain-containing protein [Priestia megaterium]MBU8586941.1 oligosaccharide flippase family protein [Priestia megaterium]
MNSYKKLVNNSIIFAIGNLGTKLIVFFLIPIYTTYLTKSEFGTADLLTSTLSFLLPIFTLSIFDSVLRFTMDKGYNSQEVLMNSLIVMIMGFFISFLAYPILISVLPFKSFILLFYILMFIQAINVILTQYIRAIGMVKLFAANGIVNAIALLFFNLIFLIIFHLGIKGYLYAFILSNIISSLVVIIGGKMKKDFVVKKVNVQLAKEMMKYSIPLIPNALMWWIMGLSDRYIINYFLGLSATGMYAVANKIPSILNVVNSIFFQAWQMSAIEEVNSKEKSQFFSKVFNNFAIVMLISTSVILILLKIIIKLLAADSYFNSWNYVPFLLLGIVFSSFSGFLGTNYIANKKTSGVFKTSAIGAGINIILNLLLIPLIGINGASIGTMISFLIIWLLRIKDTKKFVEIKMNNKNLLFSLFIILLQILTLYSVSSLKSYLIQILLFSSLIFVNFSEVKVLLSIIVNKFEKNKSRQYGK